MARHDVLGRITQRPGTTLIVAAAEVVPELVGEGLGRELPRLAVFDDTDRPGTVAYLARVR